MKRKKVTQGTKTKAPLIKCLLCGKTIKITRWRSHLRRFHSEIDVEDVHLSDFYVVLKRPYLDCKSQYKCRLCGQIVNALEWKWHLMFHHKQGFKVRFRDYYIECNGDLDRANRLWYKEGKPVESDFPTCGAVINGAPKIKIMYNAVCSNRKKY